MKKFVFSVASRATGRLQIKPSGSGDENGISLTRQNPNFARASRFFVHFFAVNCTVLLPVKMPDFTFCEGRKQAMTKFILFVNLDMADRNSALEEFTCI